MTTFSDDVNVMKSNDVDLIWQGAGTVLLKEFEHEKIHLLRFS